MAIVHFETDNPDKLEQIVFHLLENQQEWAYSDKQLSSVFPVEALIGKAETMRTWGSSPSLRVSFYVGFPDCSEGDQLAVWFRLKF